MCFIGNSKKSAYALSNFYTDTASGHGTTFPIRTKICLLGNGAELGCTVQQANQEGRD
jgi:hypothetical protein